MLDRLLENALGKLAAEYDARTIIVAGGVACNERLRSAASDVAGKLGIPAYFPSKHLSTDNAAMIAAAGYFHLSRGESADPEISADVTLRLQNLDNIDAQLKGRVPYRI